MPTTWETLAAHLRKNLDNADAWAVFADALLADGDLRGRLILDTRERGAALSSSDRARIVADHGPAWRHGLPLPEGAELQWVDGFAVACRTPHPDRIDLEALRAHRSLCLLPALTHVLSDDAPSIASSGPATEAAPAERARFSIVDLLDLDSEAVEGLIAGGEHGSRSARGCKEVDPVVAVGQRWAVRGDLAAVSGRPAFVVARPSWRAHAQPAHAYAERPVLEINLVWGERGRSGGGLAVVDVLAVHPWDRLASRLAPLPEHQPDTPHLPVLASQVREGRQELLEFDHHDVGPVRVLHQSAMSLEVWVVVLRGSGGWELLAQSEHVGWFRRRILTHRRIRDADLARYGLADPLPAHSADHDQH